ncbi:MAG: hypothetical protein ACYTFD_19095 [Planctomycetota bacterium]
MREGPRIRRLARGVKWACTAAAVLILAGWVVAARFEIDVTEAYSVRVKDGDLSVRMWPSPRLGPDPYHSPGPDTYTLPLWLLLVVAVVAAAGLWWCDRTPKLPASSKDARPSPTTCPACGKELA